MSSIGESVLSLPGGAMLTLRQMRRDHSRVHAAVAETLRARTDLAHVTSIAHLHNLPEPRLVYSSLCGVVGTFHGTDKSIEYSVREWAEAFGLDAVVVPAEVRMSVLITAGWALVHIDVDGFAFTVGGRLVQDGRWER